MAWFVVLNSILAFPLPPFHTSTDLTYLPLIPPLVDVGRPSSSCIASRETWPGGGGENAMHRVVFCNSCFDYSGKT